ncbi:MAG: hypothetical protein FJ225_10565 [Lentisphaerae bacterium]|nr:hypothetical protein [Lentisphaerota bacterium]
MSGSARRRAVAGRRFRLGFRGGSASGDGLFGGRDGLFRGPWGGIALFLQAGKRRILRRGAHGEAQEGRRRAGKRPANRACRPPGIETNARQSEQRAVEGVQTVA